MEDSMNELTFRCGDFLTIEVAFEEYNDASYDAKAILHLIDPNDTNFGSLKILPTTMTFSSYREMDTYFNNLAIYLADASAIIGRATQRFDADAPEMACLRAVS